MSKKKKTPVEAPVDHHKTAGSEEPIVFRKLLTPEEITAAINSADPGAESYTAIVSRKTLDVLRRKFPTEEFDEPWYDLDFPIGHVFFEIDEDETGNYLKVEPR